MLGLVSPHGQTMSRFQVATQLPPEYATLSTSDLCVRVLTYHLDSGRGFSASVTFDVPHHLAGIPFHRRSATAALGHGNPPDGDDLFTNHLTFVGGGSQTKSTHQNVSLQLSERIAVAGFTITP